MREAHVVETIKMYLSRLTYCWYWKVSDRYSAGLPDFVGVLRGRFFGLEVKGPRGRARPFQLHTLKKIRDAGGVAGVVRSAQDVETLFKEVLYGKEE